PAIAESEALQSTPYCRSGVRGNRLARAAAEIGNRCRHTGRKQKGRIVRIDQTHKRRCCLGQARQLFVAEPLAVPLPSTAAFLNEPKPHDVLQQPNRTADAAFVREVVSLSLIID